MTDDIIIAFAVTISLSQIFGLNCGNDRFMARQPKPTQYINGFQKDQIYFIHTLCYVLAYFTNAPHKGACDQRLHEMLFGKAKNYKFIVAIHIEFLFSFKWNNFYNFGF